MDLLQREEKFKYDVLAILKELTYSKTHLLKMLEFQDEMREGSKMEGFFVFKGVLCKQEMCIVTPN